VAWSLSTVSLFLYLRSPLCLLVCMPLFIIAPRFLVLLPCLTSHPLLPLGSFTHLSLFTSCHSFTLFYLYSSSLSLSSASQRLLTTRVCLFARFHAGSRLFSPLRLRWLRTLPQRLSHHALRLRFRKRHARCHKHMLRCPAHRRVAMDNLSSRGFLNKHEANAGSFCATHHV